MRARINSILFVISVMLLMSGCAGEYAFLSVQMCLSGDDDVDELKQTIQGFAVPYGKRYLDGSKSKQRDLERLDASPPYNLIYIGLHGDDGIGMEGGNLGLSAHEVALGFSRGDDEAKAREFANDVISALKRRWTVVTVPPGRGAFPMGCLS